MREFSSFDINAVVAELQELIGSFIDKVYQIEKNDVLIKLRNPHGKKVLLLVRSGSFIIPTTKSFSTPQKPSMFAMILRKHIENGQIKKVEQHEFDRIVVITIVKRNDVFQLIIELFSNGNIILVDGERKIIMPLKQQVWAHRTIKPKESYVFPPAQPNPFNLSYEDFASVLKDSERDLVRTLARDLGFGGLYAEEICARASVEKKLMTKEVDDDTLKQLFKTLQEFLEIFRKKRFNPVVVKKDGKVFDATPLPLKKYEGYELQAIQRFSNGLEQLLSQQPKKEEVKTTERKETLERQLKRQQMMMKGFIKKAEEKKKEGELLYSNYQTVDELLREIQSILKKKDKEKDVERIKSYDIVEEFDPTENLLVIKIGDDIEKRTIHLDFRKSVAENAEAAYETSKKLREKVEGAKQAIEETVRKLKSLKTEVTKVVEEKKEEKRWWFERFRWTMTSDGNIVVGGRDAKSNEILVKKYMKESDRYVHADIHGAPSCILKNVDIHGKEIGISEKSLEEACWFAGVYSKAWKQFGEASVYWVFPSQVSKTPQSGEYLPKGAFVIRGKRNYMRCKMEMAIGVVSIDGVEKVMAGPTSAVKKRSSRFVVIQPGGINKNRFAKMLAKEFNVDVEQLLKLLPPGDVEVIEVKGLRLEE
ncbi:MAG TPA: fibronectin-binding domain-containing protein [Thermoplasmatales archaeon]|nr:fibronectin-binding domain-containing protein [Thermoplasmatales archaeon]